MAFRVPHPGALNQIVDGKYTCTKCGVTKPVSEFSKRTSRPLGISSHCKACCSKLHKNYQKSNKAKLQAYRKKHSTQNADKIKAYQSEYREANRERLRQYFLDYAKQNAGKKQAATTKRRAQKLSATPKWADLRKIERIYQSSKKISDKTGTKLHVDHVVPLSHPLVCGLHCETNLRIVPAKKNLQKGNVWWPDMPC